MCDDCMAPCQYHDHPTTSIIRYPSSCTRCCFHQHHNVSTQRLFEFASHLTNQFPGSFKIRSKRPNCFFVRWIFSSKNTFSMRPSGLQRTIAVVGYLLPLGGGEILLWCNRCTILIHSDETKQSNTVSCALRNTWRSFSGLVSCHV